MAENILEERGYFWWNDEPIPKGHFAPAICISGTLAIDQHGGSHLDLDGYFDDSEGGPMATFVRRGKQIALDKSIQGKLKDSGRSVLLLGLRKGRGSFRSDGISYEGFIAANCLVGEAAFPSASRALTFSVLEIELTGLEAWLRLGNIEVTRTKTCVSVKQRLPKPDVYELDDGILTMRYEITGPWPGRFPHRTDKLELVESATLQFKAQRQRTLIEMRDEYARMQDLIILLTGSNYSLDWPRLKIGKQLYRYYYEQHPRSSKAPTWDNCWTNFVQLRPDFGSIVDTWRLKRERFGPGFYLYLAGRRGMKMYVEHRFVNLIWGLESLHRRKGSERVTGTKLAAKIQRILDQISDKKDRRWLENRLKNVAEPSLQDRLAEVLSTLPFDIDSKRLQKFCGTCADRRNDISHFGGRRHEGDYSDFLLDLFRKAEALTYLYHAVLLHEIGVEDDLLRQHMFVGPSSYRAKFALQEAGLLPKEQMKKDSHD